MSFYYNVLFIFVIITFVNADNEEKSGVCPRLFYLLTYWGPFGIVPWFSIFFSEMLSSSESGTFCTWNAFDSETNILTSSAPFFWSLIFLILLSGAIYSTIWYRVKKAIETINFRYPSLDASIRVREPEYLLTLGKGEPCTIVQQYQTSNDLGAESQFDRKSTPDYEINKELRPKSKIKSGLRSKNSKSL